MCIVRLGISRLGLGLSFVTLRGIDRGFDLRAMLAALRWFVFLRVFFHLLPLYLFRAICLKLVYDASLRLSG